MSTFARTSLTVAMLLLTGCPAPSTCDGGACSSAGGGNAGAGGGSGGGSTACDVRPTDETGDPTCYQKRHAVFPFSIASGGSCAGGTTVTCHNSAGTPYCCPTGYQCADLATPPGCVLSGTTRCVSPNDGYSCDTGKTCSSEGCCGSASCHVCMPPQIELWSPHLDRQIPLPLATCGGRFYELSDGTLFTSLLEDVTEPDGGLGSQIVPMSLGPGSSTWSRGAVTALKGRFSSHPRPGYDLTDAWTVASRYLATSTLLGDPPVSMPCNPADPSCMPPTDTRVPGVLLYDRTTDAWTSFDGGAPNAFSGWVGERLVVVEDPTNVISVRVFDAAAKQWTRSPPPPADFPAAGARVVSAWPVVSDGVVIVVQPFSAVESWTYHLDVTTMTWSRGATLGSAGGGGPIDGSSRFAASFRSPDTHGSEMYLYDYAADRWVLAPVPAALQSTSGGLTYSAGRVLWNNLAYDPVADRWAKSDLPMAPTDGQKLPLLNTTYGADYILCTGCSATPSCAIWRYPREMVPYCAP